MHGHVPQALRVEHEARAAMEVQPHLGRRIGQPVGTRVHQEHVALGKVGELDPAAHDPTLVGWIEPVVVVSVEAPERGVVILRLELDHADASEIGADRLDLVHERRARGGVRREAGVLVGALVTLVPEAAAVELTVGGGDRRKVGVAAALPVHVLEAEVFALGHRLRKIAQLHESPLGQHGQARMRRVEWDLARPVLRCGPEGRCHAASVEVAAVRTTDAIPER